MATKKKLLQAAAGNAGGEALNVEDVFSTYLYDGTSASLTINNGIDLAGEDGLTWIKCRNAAEDHFLFSSLQNGSGQTLFLKSNTTGAAVATNGVSQTATGFTVPVDGMVNQTGNNYASWTFRKAPKFFDCVTWSGNSTSGRAIPHNLGTTPGMIIVKWYDGTQNWAVWHKDLTAGQFLLLNDTNAAVSNAAVFTTTSPTDSVFYVGNDYATNGTNATYVAYLFAHNDGDGDFGPDGDADIIKCGGYTGNGSTTGPVIDLGFEPQWIIQKRTDGTSGWTIADTMRGFDADGKIAILRANQTNAETSPITRAGPVATGFQPRTTDADWNASGSTYIYMAIRRGTKVPESGTEVYSAGVVQNNTGRTLTNPLGHPSDWAFTRGSGEEHWIVQSRLTGKADLKFDLTNAEVSNKAYGFGNNTNYEADGTAAIGAYGWNFRRAPGYFDVVAYSGTGSNRTVSHNLTVAPEMMWIKCRSASESWAVYHAGITNPEQNYLYLDESSALNPNANTIKYWNNTNPTDSVFTVGIEDRVNGSAKTYIAYLFASLPNVSKCGSYTGNGSSQTINAGFTAGARFILIKRTDSTGDWYVWDTSRGVVTGNSPHLSLNTNVAEVTSDDSIDPDSSGFIVNQIAATNINVSSAAYIYYAVA